MLYKLPISCLIIVLYISVIYFYDRHIKNKTHHIRIFDRLLITGIIYLVFDVLLEYTVNHLDTVPDWINMLCHLGFLWSLDYMVLVIFEYIMHITGAKPKTRPGLILVYAPFVLCMLILLFGMGSLEYRIGQYTNYSMGPPVYTCYIIVVSYVVISIVLFFRKWKYLQKNKRLVLGLCLPVVSVTLLIQMIYPEILITSLSFTMMILAIYIHMENAANQELNNFHTEVVYSFANMIESRDGSTGGHVKRTTRYVELIVHELINNGDYTNILTKDYVDCLIKAAPMHDVGKISVPDAILQKPGKLTDDEYEQMKKHTVTGAALIDTSMKNLGDEQYIAIAHEVALYHHEKWNGRGYPEQLSGTDIPLCARIMSVADVFDAVSQNRCYRDAMSLDQSFEIIRRGSGTDFDPAIAEIFIRNRDKVEEIYNNFITMEKKENI